MIVKIYIGTYKVDLFKDESISITSSVLDIEDITKNTTDYTKSFTVPATANNNSLFKHYYEADIDNTFDARIKIDGRIELDGFQFRKGKWLLQKVSVKKGNPSSYTINFWGNLVSIKDVLGNKELSELNLTALDHDYNSTTVIEGLKTGLFSGKIIYNLFVKRQLYYNSLSSVVEQTDKITNIAYNTPNGINGVRYSELRPSIKLITIIEAIETDNSIVFSREFFGRSEFSNLYLWLNSEKSNKIGGGKKIINWDSGDFTFINAITNLGTYNTQYSNPSLYFELRLRVTPQANFITVPYTLRLYVNDILKAEKNVVPLGVLTIGVLDVWLNSPTNSSNTNICRWEVESATNMDYTAYVDQYEYSSIPLNSNPLRTIRRTSASVDTISSVGGVSNNMPKIKIIDFLKGLFQMFKLVVIPQDNGTIYINTLKDYYLQGKLYDVTKYINFDSYDVERGAILNEIIYKFQDPITLLNKQFKINNIKGYGDEIAYLKDVNNVLLDGSALSIEVPFEQFIYDRLNDINDGTATNIMYGAIIDDKISPVNPKPHIFYNINQSIGEKSITILNESNGKVQLNSTINTPSHINDNTLQQFSTTFSQEFNEWDGNLISTTLYSNYHQQYINNVFNIKRRNFVYKASMIPQRILMKLKLNDMIKIKEKYFRIDKFTTDLTTGETSFNLVNSFDYSLAGFSTSAQNIVLTKDAQAYSAFVTNLTLYSVVEIDAGYGVGWINTTDNGTNLIFTVTANTGLRRYIYINITDSVSNQMIQFYIIQNGAVINSDNTNIKADTNLITADHG